MANWNIPVLKTPIAESITAYNNRDLDVARMFDSGTIENIPEGAIRFNVSSGLFQKRIGGQWVTQSLKFGAFDNIITAANNLGNSVTVPTLTVNSQGRITARNSVTIRSGNTSQTGIVQLSTSISSTSTTLAATPSAVRSVRNTAISLRDDIESKLDSSDNLTSLTNPATARNNLDIDSRAEYLNRLAAGVGSLATRNLKEITTPSAPWVGIAWSPELSLFVATSAGGSNVVMTSPDGINWTTRTAPSGVWLSVTWSPEINLFVAVSFSGSNRVMTSPNGINWTVRTAPSSAWRSVTWSPNLNRFVAVADVGTNSVMYSSDGFSWTGTTSPLSSGLRDITWSPELGMFVAVASDGTNKIMTSPNGINWTLRTAPLGDWHGVTWSPELRKFVVVGYNTTNKILTSTDGITWVAVPNTEEVSLYGVTWSAELGLFVAVSTFGADSSRILVSPDGDTWSNRTTPNPQNVFYYQPCWSPELGLLVITAESGSLVRSL